MHLDALVVGLLVMVGIIVIGVLSIVIFKFTINKLSNGVKNLVEKILDKILYTFACIACLIIILTVAYDLGSTILGY